MGQILEAMIEFFEDDGWPFSHVETQPALQMMFRGEHGEWMCYAQARENDQQFMFYSVCPVRAPAEQRLRMAEFITRANYGLLIGNFEMDFLDGELRYKTGLDLERTPLTHDLIRPAVYANVASMDRYLPGILKILHSEIAAAEAIAQIEGGPQAGPPA
jgi:hypothetical protein